MQIETIDHFVLTVNSIEETIKFYRTLGMVDITFGQNRKALIFGNHKINLHKSKQEFEPNAQHPLPGSADFCLITTTPLENAIKELERSDIHVILGPIARTGSKGKINSIYIRDPDGNLIEIANRIPTLT